MDKEKPLFQKVASSSKRLRAVIWHLWKQSEQPGDFEIFYEAKMKDIIDQTKELLESNGRST